MLAPLKLLQFTALALFLIVCIEFWSPGSLSALNAFYPGSSPRLEQLSSTSPSPFPKKIWQTSKVPFASWEQQHRDVISTWTKLNPTFRWEALTAESSLTYVCDHFNQTSDIRAVFEQLHDPILRADMIRYVVLYTSGGIYADIDVKLLKPVEHWIPMEFLDRTNLVVGIEFDALGRTRWRDWPSDLGLATWTIMAKPRHPAVLAAIRGVIDRLNALSFAKSTPLSALHPTYLEVLNTTGPQVFTDAVFGYLASVTSGQFVQEEIMDLRIPKLVDDVLILPVTAFGCGQLHSNSNVPERDEALVQHLFFGTWKQDHPLNAGNGGEKEKQSQEEVEPTETQVKQSSEAEVQETEQEEKGQVSSTDISNVLPVLNESVYSNKEKD